MSITPLLILLRNAVGNEPLLDGETRETITAEGIVLDDETREVNISQENVLEGEKDHSEDSPTFGLDLQDIINDEVILLEQTLTNESEAVSNFSSDASEPTTNSNSNPSATSDQPNSNDDGEPAAESQTMLNTTIQNESSTVNSTSTTISSVLSHGQNVEWIHEKEYSIYSTPAVNTSQCRISCLQTNGCTAWRFSTIDIVNEIVGLCEMQIDGPRFPFRIISLSQTQVLPHLYISGSHLEADHNPCPLAACQVNELIPNSYGSAAKFTSFHCIDLDTCLGSCSCDICDSPLHTKCPDSSYYIGNEWNDIYSDITEPLLYEAEKTWGCSFTGFSHNNGVPLSKSILTGVNDCHNSCLDNPSCVGYSSQPNISWGDNAPMLCTLYSSTSGLLRDGINDTIQSGLRDCGSLPSNSELYSVISRLNDTSLSSRITTTSLNAIGSIIIDIAHLYEHFLIGNLSASPDQARALSENVIQDILLSAVENTEFPAEFLEEVTQEDKDQLEEVAKSIWRKFVEWLKKIWRAIKAFFGSLAEKNEEDQGNKRRLNSDSMVNKEFQTDLPQGQLSIGCGKPDQRSESLGHYCSITCIEEDLGFLFFEVFHNYAYADSQQLIAERGKGVWIPAFVAGACSDYELQNYNPGPSIFADHYKPGEALLSNQTNPKINYGSTITVQSCNQDCLDDKNCVYFNWRAPSCLLKNDEVLVDLFPVQPSRYTDIYCKDICESDMECTKWESLPGSCELIPDDAETISVRYPSNQAVASGPFLSGSGLNLNLISEGYHVQQQNGYYEPRQAPFWDVEPVTGNAEDLGLNDPETDIQCRSDWIEYDGMCLRYFQDRISLDDAEHTCSDMDSWLYTPETSSDVDALCDILVCMDDNAETALGRDILWTGARKNRFQVVANANEEYIPEQYSKSPLDQDMVTTALIDTDDFKHKNIGLGSCLVFNTRTRKLHHSTCDSYCAVSKDLASNSSNCTSHDVYGKLAIARKPFVCSYSLKDLPTTGPRQPPRKIKYVDSLTGNSHCAATNTDRPGGDMFAFETYGWEECEGSCRDIVLCSNFTYVPPICEIYSYDITDTGEYVPSLSMSLPLEYLDGLSFTQQCDRICNSSPECNAYSVARGPKCYLKNNQSGLKTVEVKNWVSLITGPVDCDAEDHDENDEIIKCPSGFEYVEDGSDSLCVAIHFKRVTAIEADRICKLSGSQLANMKSIGTNSLVMKAFCPNCTGNYNSLCLETCISRGIGTFDGVYTIGIRRVEIDGRSHWVDGDGDNLIDPMFGGSHGHPPLQFLEDGTVIELQYAEEYSSTKDCTYLYPRNQNPGNGYAINGSWGTMQCESRCVYPVSPVSDQSFYPSCTLTKGSTSYEGKKVPVQRFFVCTKEPNTKIF